MSVETVAGNKLLLEIVTPYGQIFSGEVDEVSAAGSEGEFGVLPGHAPFVSTLSIGILVSKAGSTTHYFFISWGYAEVDFNKVLILADSAERAEDIDLERAKEAKRRAEERLRQMEHIDFGRATASLERAVMRMQVAEKGR